MQISLDETLMISARYVAKLLPLTFSYPFRIIEELLGDVLSDISPLYKASEAVSRLTYFPLYLSAIQIALLDMLWSFSHCSLLRNYRKCHWIPSYTHSRCA